MRRATLVTTQQIRVSIGREVAEGYPVQAQYLLSHVSGSPERNIGMRFSNARTGRPSRRTDGRKGGFRAVGSLVVEVALDGGFPILLSSRFAYQSTTGAGPYTHSLSNLFGGDTFTLIYEDPKWLTVFAGCTVGNFSMGVGEGADGPVVQATCEVYALSVFFVPNTGGNKTVWGMDTAAFGTLTALNPEDALVNFNGKRACISDFTLTANRQIDGKLCRNGKNGVEGYIEGDSDTGFSANGFYPMTEQFYRSAGFSAEPAGPWGDTSRIVTDAVTIDFQQETSGGLTPRLLITIPKASTTTTRPIPENGAIRQTLECMPLDAAAGDVQISLTNSVAAAVFVKLQPTPAFASIPPNQWTWYWGGDIRNTYAGPSATIPVTTPSYHIKGVEAVATPGIRQAQVIDNQFVGMKFVLLSGSGIGTSGTVTANVAATDTITINASIAAAASGDRFALVDA